MAPLAACSQPIRAAICAAHPSVSTLRRTMPPQIAHHGPSHPTMRPGRCRDEHGRAGLHARRNDETLEARMAGPLTGLRMVEMAGLGPGPFCAMLFADLGAEVIAIDRPGVEGDHSGVTGRGKRRLSLDLRQSGPRAAALALIAQADWLVEGFRPGVMERLGLGPAECQALNPRLVYGRITGWGQSGP